ncbi:MAG: ATP-dependent zinc metalloprotease FtsH, partial [Bacillota bacterium]|nr:ATP-dependent zinc metalloprotease FtsH [Bacillota bacterium]
MRNLARGATIYIVLFLIVLLFLRFFNFSAPQTEEISYDAFVQQLNSNQIKEVQIEGGLLNGVLKNDRKFKTYIPPMLSVPTGIQIESKAAEGHLVIKGVQPKQSSPFLDFLPSMLVMLLLMGVLWFFFANNSQGGNSKVMNFGKSRAKMAKQTGARITFADVAGLKEEKEELEELVDFLKSPKRYTALGARIPKGVLMVGPPGTGKTYLSRATAGEAGVPFYSISGSDFVEMFVGVGASRVRDLFDEAKKNAPCIIFIDEIDAVGRKRGAGLGGGHDEREQTLNQLLVEMDGFNENQGVIVMAATNRADILDPALLRPGRFDREIQVGLPDVREREEIIKVHARNKPVADDVSFEGIARSTPGFTPADIENVLNEAALMSAREKDRVIRMDVIKKAITKTIAGIEKKSRVVTEKERNLTAYHEAGHAVLAKLLPDSDPVHQVTIIPRGYAGGFTLQYPEEDRNYVTKQMLERELVVLLGGRVA